MTCMVGSHAERQPHIQLLNANLTCADRLPMIIWLARLSHSPDLFCSAGLIASSFCLITNTLVLEGVDEAEFNES